MFKPGTNRRRTMKAQTIKRLASVLLPALLAAATAGRLGAWEMKLGRDLPPVDFHGFASQGLLYSGNYNYLGESTRGSFNFTEVGLNISFNPFPRTRIAAQGFAYDVGRAGEYDAVLDYALAEYTFNDYFGIRAGRIRRPQGIYNHIQDVDVARTFVLLPQGIYDARWRDFYVSLDGGEIFGTLPLKQAGSLSYDIYAGTINPSGDGGAALQIRDSLPSYGHLDSIDSAKMFGGQLWWNTPVEGLRLGAAGGLVPVFNFTTTIRTPAGSFRPNNRTEAVFQQYSAEYLWKAWTFQTEFYLRDFYPEAAGAPETHSFSWYASAAYRFNKWIEAGSYYTEYYGDIHNRSGAGLPFPSDASQKDAALALRFDLTERWIFKVEGHYIRGTSLLQDNANNPVRNNDGWWMIGVKSTISF
jgi:hypothetical protein